MKLVLCSEISAAPKAVEVCIKLVGKPKNRITVAVINEAYAVEEGNKYWMVHNLCSIAENFTHGMDSINLLALPLADVERRIMQRDVIVVLGGHTDYLMQVFNKTGFSKLLPKLLETKVYMGSSAGSMVIGKRISTKAYARVYGEANDYGVTEYLGLVDLALKPHLGSKIFTENRPEVLQEVASGRSFPVYGLADDSALVVDGDKQQFIGSEPYRVR